jgi:hypothetical protein
MRVALTDKIILPELIKLTFLLHGFLVLSSHYYYSSSSFYFCKELTTQLQIANRGGELSMEQWWNDD